MKQRTVVFAPEAEDDLINLYDWIVSNANPAVAIEFTGRIEDFCLRLDMASERGTLRDDIRPGLRVVGFERRIVAAFTVTDDEVTILRLFYGGRDWERAWP